MYTRRLTRTHIPMLWEGFLVKIPDSRRSATLPPMIHPPIAITAPKLKNTLGLLQKRQDDVQIMEGDDIEPCLLYQPLGGTLSTKLGIFYEARDTEVFFFCVLFEARWWKRDGSRASLQQWATGTFDAKNYWNVETFSHHLAKASTSWYDKDP